jgi:HBS1 N-terminus
MSKHRIKSVNVDDDYEDDYDQEDGENGYADEDGLSSEDQEKLRLGTDQVRNALGRNFALITDKAIQDTLWHYYYDTAKSVNYLKSTFLLVVSIEQADRGRHLRFDTRQAGQDKGRESGTTSIWSVHTFLQLTVSCFANAHFASFGPTFFHIQNALSACLMLCKFIALLNLQVKYTPNVYPQSQQETFFGTRLGSKYLLIAKGKYW